MLTKVSVGVYTEKKRGRSRGRMPKVLGATYLDASWPLQDISLTARPGEVVGIYDATGQREALLLRVMAEILRPDKGSVKPSQRTAYIAKPSKKHVRGLSLGQSIHVVSGLMGMTDAEIEQRFDDIAAAAGISKKLHQPAEDVPFSLVQQIAFCAGVRMPVQVYCFDQTLPTGSQEFKPNCLPAINELRDSGAVVAASLGKSGDIRTYVDRGLLMTGDSVLELRTTDFILEVEAAKKKKQKQRRKARRSGT